MLTEGLLDMALEHLDEREAPSCTHTHIRHETDP
jgi:hypothetical protein